jgi:hypothetical protein
MRIAVVLSIAPDEGGAQRGAVLRLGPRGLALAASLPLSDGRLARGTRALAAHTRRR